SAAPVTAAKPGPHRATGIPVCSEAMPGTTVLPCRYSCSVGRARVEYLGDVRVVHQGNGLALGFEAGDDTLGVHAHLDHLERDLAAHWFLLLGHIDQAASPFADLLEEFVAAYAVTRLFGGRTGTAHRRARDLVPDRGCERRG